MIEISKDNFEEEVLSSRIPVLMDFWGPSCGPCLALMPYVEQMAGQYQELVKVCKVNAAQNRRLCINLKVITLPTFILYSGGKELRRLGTEVKKEDILKCFEELSGLIPK